MRQLYIVNVLFCFKKKSLYRRETVIIAELWARLCLVYRMTSAMFSQKLKSQKSAWICKDFPIKTEGSIVLRSRGKDPGCRIDWSKTQYSSHSNVTVAYFWPPVCKTRHIWLKCSFSHSGFQCHMRYLDYHRKLVTVEQAVRHLFSPKRSEPRAVEWILYQLTVVNRKISSGSQKKIEELV